MDPPSLTNPRLSALFGRRERGARLNVAYCLGRGVAPLDWSETEGGTLTLGMADPEDRDAIEAIRFATGANVVPVPMSIEEVRTRLEDYQLREKGVAAAPPSARVSEDLRLHAGALDRGPSLAGVISDRVKSRSEYGRALEPLGALLSGGYTLSEAGAVILAAHAAGERFDGPDLALAEHLRAGGGLESLQDLNPGVPDWMRRGMVNLPSGAGHARVLAELVASGKEFSDRRGATGRLLAEIVVLGIPAVASWWSLSALASLLLAMLGLVALVHVGQLGGRGRSGDFVRAHVLQLIAVLCSHRVPPAAAIRCGLERLHMLAPTWGRVPETREELARALELEPLPAAMMARGDLETAARCTARECAHRGRVALDNWRTTIRVAAIALIGLAVSLQLS